MKRGRCILPILMLLGAAVSVCADEKQFSVLDSLFVQKNYQALRTRLLHINSDEQSQPAVLFYRAFLHQDADSALALYKKVVTASPHSNYAEQALLRIGQFYFFQNEFIHARSYFSALFKTFPQSSLCDDAQYYYCQCVMAQGKPDSARAFLAAFIKKKESSFVDQAVLDLEQLGGAALKPEKEYFTIKVAAFQTRAEAHEGAQKLGRVFSHVEIVEPTADSFLWSVTVGKFAAREKAQQYAEMYIQPTLPTFKIISRRQRN